MSESISASIEELNRTLMGKAYKDDRLVVSAIQTLLQIMERQQVAIQSLETAVAALKDPEKAYAVGPGALGHSHPDPFKTTPK